MAENGFKNKEKLKGKSTFHKGNSCSKSVRSPRMFITKNIGVNEKVPIYCEIKTQPTIKVSVIYLLDVKFDVKACDML